MATPLRSFHSSISSSSRVGTRLRRKATTNDCRRAQCWGLSSCSTFVSETRSIVTASTAASYGPMLPTAAARTAAVLGRGSTQPPRGAVRLFSAAAPLFGDTIIVTKRCAEVLATSMNIKRYDTKKYSYYLYSIMVFTTIINIILVLQVLLLYCCTAGCLLYQF